MDVELGKIQNVSCFLAALAHGAEQNLGQGSLSVCNLAGKKFGMEAVRDVRQTSDPVEAVEVLRQALASQGIVWAFEPFQGERATMVEPGPHGHSMRLVFRTCMVRCALFRYAHEQKQSLCYMAHGVFAGAMEKVMPNTQVRLEILHAGPNGCLKEMTWEVRS
jgi:hypothetical protein